MFVAERLQFLLHAPCVSGKYPLTKSLTASICCLWFYNHVSQYRLRVRVKLLAFNAVGLTVKHGLTVTLTTETQQKAQLYKD